MNAAAKNEREQNEKDVRAAEVVDLTLEFLHVELIDFLKRTSKIQASKTQNECYERAFSD